MKPDIRAFVLCKKITLAVCAMLIAYVTVVGQGIGREPLPLKQYNLQDDGRPFLLQEAQRASFFMLGELHGEQEVPQLLSALWPEMYRSGYQHIAAEISPWTADKLQSAKRDDTLAIEGLWTNKEARFVCHTASNRQTLWGCDMEEISLDLLIRDLARENRQATALKNIEAKIKTGYNRKLAPALLTTLAGYQPASDLKNNTISLYESILLSLKIDSARAFPESRFKAQLLRENMMKDYFIRQYRQLPVNASRKILFRFGRNHLHRGLDGRGVSTLGNFISEFAIGEGLKSFNVACFAAGGQCKLLGDTFDADERNDDLAFRFLSEQARYDQTIFDLRPLRVNLHKVSEKDRTDLDKRLLFWADSYDAIICFRSVTPRDH